MTFTNISSQEDLIKNKDDYYLALQSLGYNREEIKRALKTNQDALVNITTIESGIKIILKNL